MSEVIYGRDVVLDIFKVDDYYPFVCAENVSIEVTQETKSVKTIGDGKWAAFRGQKLGYTVSGDGIIPYDDATNVHAFDIVDRQLNMLHVPFRMVFRDQQSNVFKAMYGQGLVTTTNLSGPNDFAGCSFSILGSGPLVIYDGLTACDAVIGAIVLNSQTDTTATFGYSGLALAERLEYDITIGIVHIKGVILAPASPAGTFTVGSIIPNGTHTITVTPFCVSGNAGTPSSLIYVKT